MGVASVRLMSNATLLPTSTPTKRSQRFISTRVGTTALPVEDITACDPIKHHFGSNISIPNIPSNPTEVPKHALTQPRFSRASRRRKNGNWSNKELAEAIKAYNNSMSMKKASEQFCIPNSSFREHCYGLRKLRNRGAKGILSTDEKQQLSDWLISMVERGFGLTHSVLKMKVSEITMSMETPFQDGILSAGWMRGWKRHFCQVDSLCIIGFGDSKSKRFVQRHHEEFL